MAAPLSHFQKRAIFLVFLIISSTFGTIASNASQTGKTTIIWSDSVFLEDGFNVEVGQILIVQPGTNIVLGDEERIIVDGRINIQVQYLLPSYWMLVLVIIMASYLMQLVMAIILQLIT